MSKGKRNEREAAELYEEAGYLTFRPQESKWGETDIFGLFDILAVGEHNIRFVQVKSNAARGIMDWLEELADLPHPDNTYAEYLVKYDNMGWRLVAPFDNDGELDHRTFVDERDLDVSMGDGIVEYLKDFNEATAD